jgi:hypothetical protein
VQASKPFNRTNLFQPILSSAPELGHEPIDVLSFSSFLELLKEEEDYFINEEDHTRLMITRIRKIFYDKWGWDTQLIRRAAKIECRYQVEIVDCGLEKNWSTRAELKAVKYYINNDYQPKCRRVTYRTNDRVFGSGRAGKIPFIYQNYHPDLLLEEKYHCDIAHVFAGLDALNNPQRVTPLPPCLSFLYKLFPYADSNADVATWLGDIATSGTDFLHHYLKNNRQPLDERTEQLYININASASDMLGNIDAYVISFFYNIGAGKGKRITEALDEYYGSNSEHRAKRFEVFCKTIGLKEWDGSAFSNEEEWIRYYTDQLRNTVAFMYFSTTKRGFKSLRVLLKIWKGKFDLVIKPVLLLQLFLTALKKQL